jgi:hypothetical protein
MPPDRPNSRVPRRGRRAAILAEAVTSPHEEMPMADRAHLDGKAALVTGGSGGIGLCIAEQRGGEADRCGPGPRGARWRPCSAANSARCPPTTATASSTRAKTPICWSARAERLSRRQDQNRRRRPRR